MQTLVSTTAFWSVRECVLDGETYGVFSNRIVRPLHQILEFN